MITAKISKVGGYIMGDGPCPFEPDDAMKHIMSRIFEANGGVCVLDHDKVCGVYNAAPVLKIKELKTPNATSKKLKKVVDDALSV